MTSIHSFIHKIQRVDDHRPKTPRNNLKTMRVIMYKARPKTWMRELFLDKFKKK